MSLTEGSCRGDRSAAGRAASRSLPDFEFSERTATFLTALLLRGQHISSSGTSKGTGKSSAPLPWGCSDGGQLYLLSERHSSRQVQSNAYGCLPLCTLRCLCSLWEMVHLIFVGGTSTYGGGPQGRRNVLAAVQTQDTLSVSEKVALATLQHRITHIRYVCPDREGASTQIVVGRTQIRDASQTNRPAAVVSVSFSRTQRDVCGTLSSSPDGKNNVSRRFFLELDGRTHLLISRCERGRLLVATDGCGALNKVVLPLSLSSCVMCALRFNCFSVSKMDGFNAI